MCRVVAFYLQEKYKVKTYENGSTVRQNNQAYLADIDFQSGVQLRIILNTSQYTSFQKMGSKYSPQMVRFCIDLAMDR